MTEAAAGETGWQAEVLWCPAATPGNCILLRDKRGPHAARADCEARAREMLATGGQALGPPLQAGWRCRNLQEAARPLPPGGEIEI